MLPSLLLSLSLLLSFSFQRSILLPFLVFPSVLRLVFVHFLWSSRSSEQSSIVLSSGIYIRKTLTFNGHVGFFFLIGRFKEYWNRSSDLLILEFYQWQIFKANIFRRVDDAYRLLKRDIHRRYWSSVTTFLPIRLLVEYIVANYLLVTKDNFCHRWWLTITKKVLFICFDVRVKLFGPRRNPS